jgi:hypothetical protein
MYHDLKATCWCYGSKRDVAKYIAICDRESRPSINDLLGCHNLCKYPIESGKGLLWNPLWDCLGLSLDMISLWVIVDRLNKVAHFRPLKTTYTGPQLAELYSYRIVGFRGVPMRIVSDRETQVILMFWERLHHNLGYPLELQFCLSPTDQWTTKRVN